MFRINANHAKRWSKIGRAWNKLSESLTLCTTFVVAGAVPKVLTAIYITPHPHFIFQTSAAGDLRTCFISYEPLYPTFRNIFAICHFGSSTLCIPHMSTPQQLLHAACRPTVSRASIVIKTFFSFDNLLYSSRLRPSEQWEKPASHHADLSNFAGETDCY
jgi:hypothetical protein